MDHISKLAAGALNSAMTTRKSSDLTRWRPALNAYEPSLVDAATLCAQFIADVMDGRPAYWLTLTGACGCGKTMLAQQTFNEAGRHNTLGNAVSYERNRRDENDRRPECVWMDVTRFADRMRGGEYDLPEYLARDFIVVIDDLGAARDKNDFIADG